jgi:hypothetical protein
MKEKIMSVNNTLQVSYGLSQALINELPFPVPANRAPLGTDKAPLGTMWVDKAHGAAYIATAIANNVTTWSIVASTALGLAIAGVLTVTQTATIGQALTVTTGGLHIVAGGATITAGDVDIVAGNLTVDAGDLTVTLGDLAVDAGDVTIEGANASYYLADGMRITSGAGAPGAGLAVQAGDIYVRSDPAGAASRIYIATGAGVWTNVTCAA